MSVLDKSDGINIPLLRKSLEWATSEWMRDRQGEDGEWRQEHWFCSTGHCIAGHIAIGAGWTPTNFMDASMSGAVINKATGVESTAHEVAQNELGLMNDHNLFSGSNEIWDLWRVAEKMSSGELRAPVEVDEAAIESGWETAHLMNMNGGCLSQNMCPCGCMETFSSSDLSALPF